MESVIQVKKEIRPKTCGTCAHARGGFSFGKCALSGSYQSTERKYPTVCGKNFEGHAPMESILKRFKYWLYKN